MVDSVLNAYHGSLKEIKLARSEARAGSQKKPEVETMDGQLVFNLFGAQRGLVLSAHLLIQRQTPRIDFLSYHHGTKKVLPATSLATARDSPKNLVYKVTC